VVGLVAGELAGRLTGTDRRWSQTGTDRRWSRTGTDRRWSRTGA